MTQSELREANTVRLSLEPLFQQAERDGLMFHCQYQDLWFTPKQLREAQSQGKFLWGKCNWHLRPRAAYRLKLSNKIDELRGQLDRAVNDLILFVKESDGKQ